MATKKTEELGQEEMEAKAAKLVLDLEPLLDKESPDNYMKLRDKVKTLMEIVDPIKGLDLKAVAENVEKIKAKQEQISDAIRSHKGGFYVPGIEDQKFSLWKAMMASKIGSWKDVGAEKERDILQEVWKKHGDKIVSMKGQSIGDDSKGGNFVPDQVIAQPIGAIYTRSAFINMSGEGTQRITVLDGLTGAPVKIPRWDGGLAAHFIGEKQNAVKSDASTGGITFNPKKLNVAVDITKEMRDFGGLGWDRFLEQEFVRATAKKLDWAVPYAKGGDNQPRGILNTLGIKIYSAEKKGFGVLGTDLLNGAKFQADWDGAVLDFDGLDSMDLALEEDDVDLDDSAAIVSSPRFFRYLKQLKAENYSGQTTGLPYLLGMPMLSDQKLREFIGDFGKTSQIKSNLKPGASIGAPTDSTNEKYTDVIKGNFAQVMLARWGGIEIMSDRGLGTGFLNDVETMKLGLYVDINVGQPRMLIVCPDAKVRA